MYRIDRDNNQITKLKSVSFSEMGFRERNHLQEWLAKTPEALGEDPPDPITPRLCCPFLNILRTNE